MQKPVRTFFSKLLVSYLIIALLPLIVLSPLAYVLTRNILIERTKETTQDFASLGYLQLQSLVEDSCMILDTIVTDPAFQAIYQGPLDEETETALYNTLFLLLTGRQNKPGIYVIHSSGDVLLNSAETPEEYYLPQYQRWGVLRKAMVAQGEPVLYMHAEHDEHTRVMSIAQYLSNAHFEGYIIIDLYEAHLEEILLKIPQNSVVNIALLDEFMTSAFILQGSFKDSEAALLRESRQSTPLISQTKEGGSRHIYSLSEDAEGRFHLVAAYPLEQIDEITSLIATITIGLGAILTLLCFYLAYIFSNQSSKPLQEVAASLQRAGEGDFSGRVHIDTNDEFGLLGASVNRMMVDMEQLIATNQQKEQSLRSAQIKALQAQLNPHFMFNCLEMIKWYILLGEVENASQTIIELGLLLRSTLDLGEGLITLAEELKIISHYLALQKRRLGERLAINWDVDHSLESLMIPRFLLQPLIENAVMHGLEKKYGKGLLEVTIKTNEEHIIFTVKDDGMGMSEERAQKMSQYRQINDAMEEGTGIQNVLRRLTLYYDSDCTMEINSAVGEGTEIVIRIAVEGVQWKNG